MENKRESKLNMWTLALGIALLPPIWAVLAPHVGITTGAVALICAGLYVANGNQTKNALKITLGFLCGDIWAVIAIRVMELMQINPDVELYITLFVMGGLAVIIGETLAKFIFTPSWLCGWAIGLTIMGPMQFADLGSLPVQIGAAMIAGVVYVGIGVDMFQQALVKRLKK